MNFQVSYRGDLRLRKTVAGPVVKPDLPALYVLQLISTSASLQACSLPSVQLRVEQEQPSARLRALAEPSAHFRVEPLAQLHAPALERLRAWAEPLARTRELPSAQTHGLPSEQLPSLAPTHAL